MANDIKYSGTDNLEVMTDAINYNSYLISTIRNELRTKDRIIDFGAGIGTFARKILKSGYSVKCVETDPTQRERIIADGISCISSASELQQGEATFIYSLNVLEHIEDDCEAIQSLYRSLQPNGLILLYVPAFMCLFSSMDIKVGHVRRYRKSELVEKLTKSGFNIRKATYVDCLGFVIALLYRLIGSDSGDINRNALIIYDRLIFPLSRLLDFIFSRFFGKNLLVIAEKA